MWRSLDPVPAVVRHDRSDKQMQSVSVQECPAYYICRPAGASCDDCLKMTKNQWQKYVKIVLGQLPLEIAGIPQG
jgi:hypothetical protein